MSYERTNKRTDGRLTIEKQQKPAIGYADAGFITSDDRRNGKQATEYFRMIYRVQRTMYPLVVRNGSLMYSTDGKRQKKKLIIKQKVIITK